MKLFNTHLLMACLVSTLVYLPQAHAQAQDQANTESAKINIELQSGADELAEDSAEEINPFDPNIEELLNEFDEVYEAETGESAWLPPFLNRYSSSCYRASCKVWARVIKSQQALHLYVDGQHIAIWQVSTGTRGRETPRFDQHPNGRIYNKYSSKSYPGGDYKGLGNMPYAVFIRGGFALHGTPKSNWAKLGQKASHGCIRMHPDNAQVFNRLVRANGIKNVWITVE